MAEKNGVRELPFELGNPENLLDFEGHSSGWSDSTSVEGQLYERIGWEPVENISAAETNKVIFREALERFRKTLTPEDSLLMNMRYKGHTRKEIRETMGIEGYRQEKRLRELKERLRKVFAEVGEERGEKTDLFEAFPLPKKKSPGIRKKTA